MNQAASLLVAVAIATVTGPAIARTQTLAVSAVAMSAHHEVLGDPLLGVGIGAGYPYQGGRKSLRFEIQFLHMADEHVGIPCGGFIEPGTCAPETVGDEAHFAGGTVGGAYRVIALGRAAFAFTGDLALARVRSNRRGYSSGRVIEATETLMGCLVGGEAELKVFRRLPLRVNLGAGLGGLLPLSREQVADGYEPFDDGFSIRELRVGMSWRL